MRILYLSLALAIGEALASTCPQLCSWYPAAAAISLVIALLGYGFELPLWRYFFVAALGLSLYLFSSDYSNLHYRHSPWLRHNRYRTERSCADETPVVVRKFISQRLGVGLENRGDVAGLSRAILLGERYRLSPRMKRLFVDTGTIHVFAISGLHVMMVARTIALILSLLMLSNRLAGVLALPLVAGYVIIVGAPPSSVRALIMAAVYFVAPLFWRRSDGVMAWGTAFLTMHMIRPQLITDVGSQLSFAVMLAILLVGRIPVKNTLTSLILVALASWLASAPITIYAFGRITFCGVLINIFLVAAASYTVVASVAAFSLSFISISLAAQLNSLAALFTEYMIGLVEIVAAI